MNVVNEIPPADPAASQVLRPLTIADRPLRIAIASYRSNPFCGGQGVYLRFVSRALVELGHRVDVISGPPYPDLDPRVGLVELPSLDLYARPRTFAGMPPPPFGEFRDGLDVREYLSHISGAFPEPYTFGERLARHLADHPSKYDIVQDNQTLSYGLLKAQAAGQRVVGLIHHPITMDLRLALAATPKFGMRLLLRRWYSFLDMQARVARKLDPVIVISKATAGDVVRDFAVAPGRLELIYHGIDHATWYPRPNIQRAANELVTVASSDVPLKGLIHLLEAYARLVRARPELKLTVIGTLREGPTKARLAELDLLDRVTFRSGLTNEEIAEIYARATLSITPSLYEGFGFPPGEAMACGVPVIATNAGALPEVVGDAGVQVPPGDPGALEAAIARLLDAPAERAALSVRGRDFITRRFGWDKTASDMTKLYYRLMGHHADHPARAA